MRPFTPLARHGQQHSQLSERLSPSLFQALPEACKVCFLLSVFARPLRLKVFQYRFRESLGNLREQLGKLVLLETIKRTRYFAGIGVIKSEVDIPRILAAVVFEWLAGSSEDMPCKLFRKV